MKGWRVGIDVGGTFTDFVMGRHGRDGLIFHKQPSVPHDPSLAVERGIAELLAKADVAAGDIDLVVHGTTLGLNAIIQKKGARVALIVAKGNRDVMEIARARMPNSYDFTSGREEPLIAREAVFEISARMLADGSILRPVDEAEIDVIARQIEREGFDAVAIMLLNSYRSGVLEERAAGLLAARLPGLLITRSAALWPEMREYERALIAAMNAYVHPLMARYFTALEERLEALGITAPLYITANNGGTVSAATARERPLDTILSGPASGVLAATRVAGEEPAVLTFDMGGTSTDIAISQSGSLEFTNSTMVGDYPLMLPVVNVSAIGAGGGSMLWVDAQGLLKVGPGSAGADPGPAAYGRGGTVPTVTDCYLVMGILNPGRFNDGRMTLDEAAARAALAGIAGPLGMTEPVGAAAAAIRVATAKMATEIRKVLATKGLDPRLFTLVAYGGAGPTHANLLAEEARLDAVLVPRLPGTFCALGAVLADVRRDYTRPARIMIDAAAKGHAAIEDLLAEVEGEALSWIAREGALIGEHRLALTAEMRYPAQAFELGIEITPFAREGFDVGSLVELFHKEHERLYGFREAGSLVQITNLRLAVIGVVPPMGLPQAAPGDAGPTGTRRVFHETWIEARVYERMSLGSGSHVAGPAIVEQPDSTVWILPGWEARGDALGNLVIRRSRS